jgi:vacuolar-type H+-ATPase subunit I/STV1
MWLLICPPITCVCKGEAVFYSFPIHFSFIDSYRERIKQLEEALDKESKQTIELSDKLENPENLERWRPLDGSDLDLEQLVAKIKVLEDRLDHKREQLLEKELILEEVTALTDKLRTQAVSKRDAAKVLADQLNELHGRIRDVTKKMLASVSELSMYQVRRGPVLCCTNRSGYCVIPVELSCNVMMVCFIFSATMPPVCMYLRR